MAKNKEYLNLAPCGLDCNRCMAKQGGKIQQLSNELQEALVNFEGMATAMSKFVPPFKGYENFKDILHFFGNAACPGCREGGGKYPACAVKDCYKEKNVEFCFECDEFPCSKNGYDEKLTKRWISKNKRMQEIGPETFYTEQLQAPRYE